MPTIPTVPSLPDEPERTETVREVVPGEGETVRETTTREVIGPEPDDSEADDSGGKGDE
jgi:hypothetical protein